MNLIPYGKQYIDGNDLKAVSKALLNNKITTGQQVERFEYKLKNFVKSKYCYVCNSGTSALFLAFQSIDVQKDDTIIMPTVNFISAHNVAKLFGAKIFLADVDQFTGQMTPKNINELCKRFKIKKVKAIVTMYNGGYPDNAENFKDFKRRYKCYIIEDACHALGATYKNRLKYLKIGSCAHSDIATFSLHPLKTITTGEGGIITTNSKKIANKIKILRSLGIDKNEKFHWEYEAKFLGFNFRLNDFQCALGSSQLSKISKFISYRKKVFTNYLKLLKNISEINLPAYRKKYSSSYHLFIITLKNQNYKKKINLIKFMLKHKIILQYHYKPIYKFKIFKGKFINDNSEIYHKSAISLPIYYGLKFKQQIFIAQKIKEYFSKD